MTIDITIGKLKVKNFGEVMKEKLGCYYTFDYENVFRMTEFLEVEQCPDDIDGCTQEDTIYPNSSYRSGATTAMSEFFRESMPDLINKIRPKASNDLQVTRIKPFIDDINKLEYNGKEKMHKVRLNWLKFWCNRAVKLYGNEAVISFS